MLAVERPLRTELLLLFVLGFVLAPTAALAQAEEPTMVRLRDAVGDTIDRSERDSFSLFPNTAGFSHAVIPAIPGPEFFADVALAEADTNRRVYFRIMPTQLERIRFLIDNREYMIEQLESDSNAKPALSSFWKTIEDQPLRSIAGEPADVTTVAAPQLPLVTSENRYNCTLLGTTAGSALGGCVGSWAGITQVRTETRDCLGNIYYEPVYAVNHPVFWAAACGITALGATAGYMTGEKLDRKPLPSPPLPNEGKGWRTCCAIGAAVPGLVLGMAFFTLAGSSHFGKTDLLREIENDPTGLTYVPMALTGLCIAVEVTTIGYQIGRAIDRKNAEKAASRRRALGR
jgi:hypothetical protein